MSLLSPDDRRRLHKILVAAFPTVADLELMTDLYLGIPREHITTANKLPNMVLELMVWAEARGRTADLIEAARNANPTHPELRELAEWLLSAPPAAPPTPEALGAFVEKAEFSTAAEVHLRETQAKSSAVPETAAEELQRIALRSIDFLNAKDFRDKMADRELAVCRVEFPRDAGQGTGFLIAPDLVMTNYHVVMEFIDGARNPSEIWCRFGFQTSDAAAAPQPGFPYELADDWLVARSPIDQLDYAIMRLKQSAPAPGDVPARPPLKPVEHEFETGEALFILQHPKTAPLKLSSGGVAKVEERRVFYLANTLKGSSGAPCFNGEWELVALHRSGEDVSNVGVPLKAIIADLQASQLGYLV